MRRKIANMKSNVKSKIIILITLGIIFALLPIINSNLIFRGANNNNDNDVINFDDNNLKISAISEPIYIDNNWSAAKIAGICTGEGTKCKPYIIQNLIIDGKNSSNGIYVRNSSEYFTIKNCRINNCAESGPSYFAGIKLQSVSNGLLINNNVSNNDCLGIYLNWCSSNEISNNTVNYNSQFGILLLSNCVNNIISGNKINNNRDGIRLDDSRYNIISENTESNNRRHAISMGESDFNDILGNIASNNFGDGIRIFSSNYNDILGNSFNNNGNGASLKYSSYNIISGNNLSLNSRGVYIESSGILLSSYNNITLNCFTNNTLNAIDDGSSSNNWDNGIKGNYWSDYTGLDTDVDGIGDTHHTIPGSAGSQDNFPLMEFPSISHINAPVITINNPQDCDVIGATAPNFDISIEELNLDETWYSLNGGNKITFTGFTGTINQALWGALSEGIVVIRFYANDTLGRIGFQEVTVVKTNSQSNPPGIELIVVISVISGGAVIGVATILLIRRKRKRID